MLLLCCIAFFAAAPVDARHNSRFDQTTLQPDVVERRKTVAVHAVVSNETTPPQNATVLAVASNETVALQNFRRSLELLGSTKERKAGPWAAACGGR